MIYLPNRRKAFRGGAAGGDLTANMLAWYDFAASGSADLDNKHNAGTYDLTANGTPSYSGSIVSCTDANAGYFDIDSLHTVFGATDQDWSMALMFRLGSGWTSADFAIFGRNGSITMRFRTSVSAGYSSIGNIQEDNSILSTGTWYQLLTVYRTSGATVESYLDGTSTGSSAGSFAAGAAVGIEMPRSGDYEIDLAWAGFWSAELDADQRTSLFALDESSAYADL